jgi:hypothetical protein
MQEKVAVAPEATATATTRRTRRRFAVVPWAAFLLEMASIVASVLLALWVSDWNDHRKEAARAEDALAGIRRELADDRGRLLESSDYYSQLAATIDRLREGSPADVPTRFTSLPAWRGVRPPLLSDDVFSAALSTQALGPIAFDVVADLSQTYGALRQHRWFHDRFLTDIYEGRVTDLGTFRGRIRDLVSMAGAVDRTVSGTIEKLDRRAGVAFRLKPEATENERGRGE